MRQALAALVCWAATAHAGEAVRAPERVTVGGADGLLASLSPSDELFYVSNENATFEIMTQALGRGGARLAFDDDGDATWPRVSPDGQQLAYLSYQSDANGDLCLRSIERRANQPLALGARRCLSDEGSAEVQAEWIPGQAALAVVTRRSLHGGFELWQYFVDGRAPRRLLARSVASPALSPDGKWLAYVPIEQREKDVGVGFAVRTAGIIEIVPLAAPATPPRKLALPLSGVSATPRFSADGRWLYFAQYLDDSNRDGAVDGNDRGVICRLPFAAGVADTARVEQLTSARTSCQYPLPTPKRLLMTCEREGKLDVYSLPLDGAVPGAWGRERLLEELAASDDAWQRQLLLGRLLAQGPADAPLLGQALARDLSAHAFDSALRDLDAIERAVAPDDTAAREKCALLRELVALRRALDRLARGQLSEVFVREAEARRRRIETRAHTPEAKLVATLALVEIDDVLGRKRAAADGMQALARALDGLGDPLLLALVEERGYELWRELDRRDLLTALLAKLALHAALPERRRVQIAQRYVAELLRGRDESARLDLLARALTTLPPDSVPALAVTLERLLIQLEAEGDMAPVYAGIIALAERQPSEERRRLVVESAVERALGNDEADLAYQLADKWLAGSGRAGAVRPRAEAVYLDAVLERAYHELRAGRHTTARQHFANAVRHTDALEAHLGYLEAALALGADVARDYAERYGTSDARHGLARAYAAARRLPAVGDALAHEQLRAEAALALAPMLEARPGEADAHHLAGWLAHQRFLRHGDRAAAEEANARYLLALDLSAKRVRMRAATLSALSLLQAEVGNHSLAMEHWLARAELPFVDARARLANCLGRARSQAFTDEEERAAKTAARCREIVAAAPELARFAPLAEERAALSHYDARQFAAARDAYARLRPLAAAVPTSADGGRNATVAALGEAAAALGAKDVAAADAALARALARLASTRALPPRQYAYALDRLGAARPSPALLHDDALIIAHGLVAQARFAAGRWDDARAALEARIAALQRRHALRPVDEDLVMLAEDAGQLAATWLRQRNWSRARAALEAGLGWADAHAARSGAPGVDDVTLGLSAAYAALAAKLPPGEPLSRPFARLENIYRVLCERRDPTTTTRRLQLRNLIVWLRLHGAR